MNKLTLQKLENKMVKYIDLINMPIKDSRKEFVFLNARKISFGYKSEMADMKKLFGNKMPVREYVAKMLYKAQKNLQRESPFLSLYVTYGYRSLEVQTKRFLQELRKIPDFYENSQNLYEETHRFVAVPTVAGHPTGGAIDIIIVNNQTGKELNFGSKQYEYQTKKCYAFYPDLSRQAKQNRYLLRTILMQVGFAPFDGEWWHFSYGDREWAFYYKKPHALYKQINCKDLEEFMIE